MMTQEISFQDRLANLRTAITAYNAAMQAHSGKTINIDQFVQTLITHGYFSNEALGDLTIDELVTMGLPMGLAKQAFKALVPPAVTTSAPQAQPQPHGHHGNMMVVGTALDQALTLPIETLVAGYDPRDMDAPYAEALLRKVRAARCVVFNTDGTVDQVVTVRLMKEIIARSPARKTISDEKGVRQVYPLGELPVELDVVAICPVHRCELRADGECVDKEESWANVSESAMQIVMLGLETRDRSMVAISQNQLELTRVLDGLRGKSEGEALKHFTPFARDVVLAYTQRKTTNQPLPQLRVPRSQLGGNAPSLEGDRGDPFAAGGDRKTGTAKEMSAEQLGAFHKVLLSAFNIDTFGREVLLFGMDLRINELATGNLQEVVGQVIEYCEQNSRLVELLRCARLANQTNKNLKSFAAQFGDAAAIFKLPNQLSGDDHKQFGKALVSAFPSFEAMCAMVKDQMNENFHTISSPKPTNFAAGDLIVWAQSKGCSTKLLEAALKQAPGNPELREFARKYYC
jgi:hypothetical protein